MKINIDKKYVTNILSKYDYKNKEAYEKAYTKKERDMWFFTLMMLKKDLDQVEYDSDNPKDVKWLNDNLALVLDFDEIDNFTLEEWFNYMASQPDA